MEQQVARDRPLDRRQILAGAGLLTLATTLWPRRVAAQQPAGRRGELVFDVACRGDTFRPDFTAAATLDPDAPDLRGTTFNVEGGLYPAGTIAPGDGVDPDPAHAVGHWFCRGFFILHGSRPLPHVLTTQDYLFDRIDMGDDPTALPPRDTLVTSGLEGGIATAIRAVVGGSGRYRNVRGEAWQETIGSNSTVLWPFPDPAPNFRFQFDLNG